MTRAVAIGLLVAGCARGPAPPPPAPPSLAAPGLVVTLVWNAPVDLDLYVTDPARETLYYANPRTASGGSLEADQRCAGRSVGPQVERARWTAPPPGRYRVGVDFPEVCEGRLAAVPFRLVVDEGGRRREQVGTARTRARVLDVLEIDVGGSPP